jgi:hypothetical protein
MSSLEDINKQIEEIKDAESLSVLYFGIKKLRKIKFDKMLNDRKLFEEEDNRLHELMNKIDNNILNNF